MILKNLKKPDLNIHKPKISRSLIAMIVGGLLLLLIGIVLLVNYGIPDDDDDLCASVTCPDASGVCKIPGTCQPVNGICLAETNVTDGTSCGDGTAGTVCTAGFCGPSPATGGTTGGTTGDLCASVTCPAASGVCKIAGTCQSASGTCSAETNVSDGVVCEEDGQGNISACLSGSCDRVACAADYHVTSGACAPCPGGETNDEGDLISTRETACDSSAVADGAVNPVGQGGTVNPVGPVIFPAGTEWHVGQSGETCTQTCAAVNPASGSGSLTCNDGNWGVADEASLLAAGQSYIDSFPNNASVLQGITDISTSCTQTGPANQYMAAALAPLINTNTSLPCMYNHPNVLESVCDQVDADPNAEGEYVALAASGYHRLCRCTTV